MIALLTSLTFATFCIVVTIAVLLLRRSCRCDTDVLLDAIDSVRDQVDSHAGHTATEHGALTKLVEKGNGRLQFLMADSIADELGKIKAAKGIE